MKRQPNNIKYSGAVTAAALLLLPLLVLWLTQTVTLQTPGGAVGWMSGHFRALLLGWVLLAIPVLLVYTVTARLWCAWLAAALPCLLLALVSHYKTAINGVPLEISDFALIGQFGEIAGFALPQLRVPPAVWIAVLGFVLMLVLLLLADRHLARKLWPRLAAALCLVLCAALLFSGVTVSLALELTGEDQTQAERIDSAGLISGLYCALAADRSHQDAYAESIRRLAEQNPGEEPLQSCATPTVIFLMSESFYDLARLPEVHMETDPIPNFHAIQQEHSSGRFIACTHSSGTGYIETEVLTGLSNFCLREADTLCSLPDAVYPSLPSITDVFSRYGYRKEFIHSYNNSIYNRSVIYPAFGFDSVRFSESFSGNTQISGGYISDVSLAREIIASYEKHAADGPQMFFAVSMENHQPYTPDKYRSPSGAGLSSDRLSEADLAVLDSYVHGLADADKSLGMLTDYFSKTDEPVMIVFWGDHAPNLTMPDGVTAFRKLGARSSDNSADWSPAELADALSTDYVIWTNYGLEKQDKTVGSPFFGLEVLNRLGFSLTDYFRWLRDGAARCCTMYRPRLFVDGDGTAYSGIPETYREVMEDYAACVWDFAYGSSGLFKSYRIKE